MDTESHWSINYDPERNNDPVDLPGNDTWTDLRRVGKWLDVARPNQPATSGCLAMTNNGLIKAEYNDTCAENRAPACEYRACMTKRGKTCQFPFNYKNETHTLIEYKYCAAVDIYTAWCPTGPLISSLSRYRDLELVLFQWLMRLGTLWSGTSASTIVPTSRQRSSVSRTRPRRGSRTPSITIGSISPPLSRLERRLFPLK